MFKPQRSKLIVTTLVKLCTIALPFFLLTRCQTTATPTAVPLPPSSDTNIRIQPGDGTDLMDRLLERGMLKVGIRVWPEADFSPPVFRGISNAASGGALTGFEVDLARLLAQELGLELELVEAYPPVIASGVWQGQWDIAIASLTPFDQPATETSTEMVFSIPYGYMPMGFLTSRSSNLETASELAGRRVGVFEHSAYQRLLTPAEGTLTIRGLPIIATPPPDLRLIVISNMQQAIRHLGQSTSDDAIPVDVIFGPIPILEQAVRADLPVELALNGDSIGSQPLAIAIAPQDGLKIDRLQSEINAIISRAQRQGVLSEIYFQWYGQDFSQPPAK